MTAPPAETRALLTLALTKGLGPVLIRRLLDRFETAERAIRAPAGELAALPRVPKSVASSIRDAETRVDEEWARATDAGVRILPITDPGYPALLRSIPDPPPLLFVRGSLGESNEPRYPVAIVGSRNASSYGLEQTTRFAGYLASAGLTIVSGGARGIDTRAHTAALREGGTTIAVLGCGLGKVYPPENAGLFDEIAGTDGPSRGAVVSEFPMLTDPVAENFPRRNRIISGLSLGVLVIEAGAKSGALITARMAVEDHGREVFVLPGRVDAPGSAGGHSLIRQGGAALVTGPMDVLEELEAPARFLHAGTHDARYTPRPETPPPETLMLEGSGPGALSESSEPADPTPATTPGPDLAEAPADGLFTTATEPESTGGLPDLDARILAQLDQPRTADELSEALEIDAASVRVRLTMLELSGRVVRRGNRFDRRV